MPDTDLQSHSAQGLESSLKLRLDENDWCDIEIEF